MLVLAILTSGSKLSHGSLSIFHPHLVPQARALGKERSRATPALSVAQREDQGLVEVT